MARSEKIRLYVDAPLGEGQGVDMSPDQAHYLGNVMRCGIGDHVRLFNGRDGEWLAAISDLRKKAGDLRCVSLIRGQVIVPDLWLLFAPVKRARTDFIVEKSVEMGVSRICPIFTEFTNSERIRPDRMRAQIREAAEQSERLCLPTLAEPAKLSKVLDDWPTERLLFFADEIAPSDGKCPAEAGAGQGAVLIGPEGGFSDAERRALLARPFTRRCSLGPRVLRADTAAVAALTLWQTRFGDWPR